MAAPTGRTRIARTAGFFGRVVRGLVAATVLAALLAGLPAALVYGVGWPMPDHLPSLEEVGAVLMAPMSAHVLLDTLACLAWPLWLAFVIDIAACALDVARGARSRHVRRQSGPVRRIAAVLVGTLLVAVLGRTADAVPFSPASTARPVGSTPAAAVSTNLSSAGQHLSTAPSEPGTRPEGGIERVRPPVDGVHDSLWRVAQRCLGEGDRWPEIWALNEGSTQPGGRVLTNPNRIHPGDLLRLPETSPQAVPAAAPRLVPPDPPPSPTQHAPPAPSTPAPPLAGPTPSTNTPSAGRAAELPAAGVASWSGGEVFVSLGLAAVVSALLLAARRRHHARYRPGSGRRGDDLPVAPVVYQLRLAHLRAQHHDHADPYAEPQAGCTLDDPTAREQRRAPTQMTAAPGDTARSRVLASWNRRVVAGTPGGGKESAPAVDIALDATAAGVDGATTGAASGGGVQVALDLAHVHGLGLVGPGGYAASRALLLTLLTVPRCGSASRVLVPEGDLARLLGVAVPHSGLPDTVTVVADFDTALTTLELPDTAAPRPAVLVATPPTEPARQARLQQLLDNGAQHGLRALLLGQWRAGVTAYVTARGIISATAPGLGEPLRGTRAFTLPETATRDLLAFLHAAQPPAREHSEPDTESPENTAPHVDTAVTTRTAAAHAAPSHPTGPVAAPAHLEITSGPPRPEPPPAATRETGEPRPLPHSVGNPAPATPAPLTLTVFGTPALRWRSGREPQDLSGALSSRPVELLVFLAMHPGGVPRDPIIDALWPDQPPRNPASVLRTILSRIRRALDTATHGAAADLVRAEHGQYQLNPAVVETDYLAFADAVTRRRTATTADARTDAYEAIVAHYGGPLADGMDSEWLVAAREATRRDALDAVAALARTRVEADPEHTLDLLETARAFDPHNELLYRDIMRLQHALGRHDTISRTLTLLQTRLAEIDATPTTDTIDLAARLRARHTGILVNDITAPRRHE